MKLGMTLFFIGAGLILAAVAGLPYILYVAETSPRGLLDPRIEWAPLGVPVTIVGMLLFKVGFRMVERAHREGGNAS